VLFRSEGDLRSYQVFKLKNQQVVDEVKTETTGKEKNKLSPTDIGIVVTDFLQEHFDLIMDYNFTAKVEHEFDEIANGMLKWTDMIHQFYDPFHKNVEDTLENSERASGERELGFHPVSGKIYYPFVLIKRSFDLSFIDLQSYLYVYQ
jgi:DNA topoisomerase-1